MKSIIHKVISSSMALLLLVSTVTWTVDKHICMGRVMDIALFDDAKDCGMQSGMAILEDSNIKNHCCGDESFTIQGQDDLKLSWNDLDIDSQSFVLAYTYTHLQRLLNTSERDVPLDTYPPPLIVKDIQLLDEVFII